MKFFLTLPPIALASLALFCAGGGASFLHAQTVASTPSFSFKHPVLECWNKPAGESDKPPKKESAAVTELMALTDDQVRAIIPDQPPTISDYCPVCARKTPPPTITQGVKPFPVEFDPLHPNQIRCEKCGTIFPNADFPLKKETMQNMLGEAVTVQYYTDEHITKTAKEKVEGKPHRLYLLGLIDNARNAWLLPRLKSLAELYQSTHEERYAKRLMLVLDEFAKRYPHYLLTTDYGMRYVTTKGQKPPYGFIDTRWSRRAADDFPQDLLALFDVAAASPSLDAVTKKRIIDGLFMDPLKRAELRDSKAEDPYYGNECPLKAIAERALVLEDPARVHIAYNLIRNTPQFATGCDGMFSQSMGYSSLFRLTFFEGARVLNGYSDPPGYVGKDGLHLENIYPMKGMEEYFHRVTTAYDQLRLPSGGWLTYDDSGSGFGPTWWSGVGNETCRPLAQSSNVLLPGLRRAVLGGGRGDKQIQVALDFAEHGVNHGHQSGLAMQIYAFGHSLVDDFPYHKSVLRAYGSHTVSHPTVVIDYQNQEGAQTAGDVELYAPLMDGVAAIRVDDRRAYNGLAMKYTRSLILNDIDPDAPYVIDIFEVAGGTTHDYMMRSSGQFHSTGSASLATSAMPGERPLLPAGEQWVEPKLWGAPIGSGYGLFFDASKAPITGPFNFTSVCDKPWATSVAESQNQNGQVGPYLAGSDSWPDRPVIGIRHHVAITTGGYEFINAATPSLVEMGFHGKEDVTTEKWPRIPHRIIRHIVKPGGASVFVVVHEPYHHAPRITSVTRLDQGDDNLVALRIEAPGRVDTLLYALDHSREVTAGGITMSGRLSLVTRRENQPPRAYLVEGTQLKAEGVELKNNLADYAGTITATQRRWDGQGVNRLRVSANSVLPPGDALRGAWMILKLGSWTKSVNGEKNEKIEKHFAGATQAVEIDHVAVEADGTWVYVKDDYGLSLTNNQVEEFYWPHRTFAGPCQFVIPTATATHLLTLPPRLQPLVVAPLATLPAGLKPGVKISSFTGTGRDLKAQQKISEKVLPKADALALEKLLVVMKLPGAIRVEGNLQVPVDGVYTFHFGVADEFRMSLAGVPVVEAFRGCSLMPETREVKLTKGCYPVALECFRVAEARDPVWATADWEGPGRLRQDFISGLSAP